MFINTSISSISHDQLNARCLVQISKFARSLYQLDGTILKLKDDNIIEQITQISDNTTNERLHTIFTQLQLEILDAIGSSEFKQPSFQETGCL